MNFAALVSRFASAAPAAAVVARASGQSAIALAITRNWKAQMKAIDEKLDTLHARRGELVGQRRDLLLAAVEGDDGAQTKLGRIERDLADTDREVARLHDARAIAADLEEGERAAEAEAARKRQRAAWDAGNARLLELAAEADAVARKAGEVFKALVETTERQAQDCPVDLGPHSHERPLGLGRAESAFRMEMAKHGAPWAWRAMPWPAPPSIEPTIRAGVEWAAAEVERANARKHAS